MKKLLYHPAYITMINELKNRRKELGLNQEELGLLIKRDQKFISRIEAFTKEIDIDELLIICAALQMSFLKVLARFSYNYNIKEIQDKKSPKDL